MENVTPRNIRFKEILTGLIVLALLFGGLLGGEVFLRLEERARFGEDQAVVEKSSLFIRDEHTGLRRANPGIESGKIRISRQGFRGPDLVEEHTSKRVTIAFLGHSTTFDAYAGETENWPYLVTQLLQQQLQGCTVDFINGAVPGFGPRHMLEYFHAYVEQYAPDITFVLTGSYNADLDDQAQQQGYHVFQSEQEWLDQYSLLLRKIRKNAEIIQIMRSAFNETNKLQPDWRQLENASKQWLEKMATQLKDAGTAVVFITIASRIRQDLPETEQLAAARSQLYYIPYVTIPTLIKVRELYNETIIATAQKFDTLLVADADSIPPTNDYFIDSSHFTAKGSRRMSERVIEQLDKSQDFINLMAKLKSRCTP